MGVSAIDLHMYAAAVNKQSLSSDWGLSCSLSPHTHFLSIVSPVCFPAVFRLHLTPEVSTRPQSHLRRKWVAVIEYTFCFHVQPIQRI